MKHDLGSFVLTLAAKKKHPPKPSPLLIELLDGNGAQAGRMYDAYPFRYTVLGGKGRMYSVSHLLPHDTVVTLRRVVADVSASLDPASVKPLTFERLIEVLTENAVGGLAQSESGGKVKELAELAAYEAVGLSRLLAFAKDQQVTEVFVDSDSSPVYVDHSGVGRCDTEIILTERERQAIETHVDTFGGYTLDYRTPSLKNELRISGAIMRVSLDLAPASVNRFAMDVRRLNPSSLSLSRLVEMNVISSEAAAFLVAWVQSGGNLTIVGETGTGKTTLLNAIDASVEPAMRRLYIEDAVETVDLLGKGFHQLKVKVDPFERGSDADRTKGVEIVKALHRSPDIVILSEIQSKEHSEAFFHALSAGARGMQTFHASTIEQAIRRWVNIHGIPRGSIIELGLMVQMARPERLGPRRFVTRVCAIVDEQGNPRIRELYARDRSYALREISAPMSLLPPAVDAGKFAAIMGESQRVLDIGRVAV